MPRALKLEDYDPIIRVMRTLNTSNAFGIQVKPIIEGSGYNRAKVYRMLESDMARRVGIFPIARTYPTQYYYDHNQYLAALEYERAVVRQVEIIQDGTSAGKLQFQAYERYVKQWVGTLKDPDRFYEVIVPYAEKQTLTENVNFILDSTQTTRGRLNMAWYLVHFLTSELILEEEPSKEKAS